MGNYTWPAFITGGDISMDGKHILLRGYDGKFNFIWKFHNIFLICNFKNIFGAYIQYYSQELESIIEI